MIQVAKPHDNVAPQTIKFPTLQQRDGTLDPNDCITVRSYYESVLLPEIKGDQEKSSLKEDRTALNHWERVIGEVDIRDVDRSTLQRFRDGLEATGTMSEATINKTWRELKPIFSTACEEELIPRVPTIGRRMRSKLIRKENVKRQREMINVDDVTALWKACSHATYPRAGGYQPPTPKLWRVLMVLLWTYGPRTLDLLNLDWSDVEFGSRLIRFTAQKTGKLQGLPMTDNIIAHLQSIHRQNARRVFHGFKSHGCLMAQTGKWKPGYYTTWRNEIQPQAGLSEPVYFKNFRQRVVNDYNAQFPSIKLGSWIAGHSMQGVSAVNYELPTKQIREAIEAAPIPECFHEIG